MEGNRLIHAAAVVGEGLFALLLFGMVFWLFRQARRATTAGFGGLARAAAAASAVSAATALQRIGSLAVKAGWISPAFDDFLWAAWEVGQLVALVVVYVWVASTLVRFGRPLGRAERMVHVLTGRLPHEVDIEHADLSPRERDVLELICAGHLSDDELAAALFIAPSTAATHVQRLLRKTGLHSRKELMLAADAGSPPLRRPAGQRGLRPMAVRLRRTVAYPGDGRTEDGDGNGEGLPAGNRRSESPSVPPSSGKRTRAAFARGWRRRGN